MRDCEVTASFLTLLYFFRVLLPATKVSNMNNSSASDQSSLQSNDGMTELSKLLPVAIAITLSNGLVFALFYIKKSLRISSNYLLLGLAVCDFFTGTVNIPYFIIFNLRVVPLRMEADFSYLLYIVHTLMVVSAAYHLLIITAEKYLAIIRPLKHYLVTKKMVFKALAGIWITSTFIAVIPLVWKNSQSRSLCSVIHSSVCLVFVFVVPYTFMIYAYIVMFRAITSKKRPSSTHRRDASRLRKKNVNDRKCVLVFALMAAIFAFCWLPYFTIGLVLNVKGYLKSNFTKPMLKASEVFAFVRYITSITNPLLYTFFKRDFWRALRNLLRKRKFGGNKSSKKGKRSALCDKVRKRKKSVDNNTSLSRLSWIAEGTIENTNTAETKISEKQILFISSV